MLKTHHLGAFFPGRQLVARGRNLPKSQGENYGFANLRSVRFRQVRRRVRVGFGIGVCEKCEKRDWRLRKTGLAFAESGIGVCV